jgi:hypothetical protein
MGQRHSGKCGGSSHGWLLARAGIMVLCAMEMIPGFVFMCFVWGSDFVPWSSNERELLPYVHNQSLT